MRTTAPLRKIRAAICGVLLTAHLGCSTAPKRVEQPAAYLQANSPKRIWVTLTNGDAMVIDAPRVYGDSLLGFTQSAQGGREEVWLPLSDLQEVKTRRHSGGRTWLMAGAIGAAVGLILIVIPVGSGSVDRPCKNEGEPCEG
jgi:hypothetical protein